MKSDIKKLLQKYETMPFSHANPLFGKTKLFFIKNKFIFVNMWWWFIIVILKYSSEDLDMFLVSISKIVNANRSKSYKQKLFGVPQFYKNVKWSRDQKV